MNGRHEVRLERIEASLGVLHEKMDALVEQSAVNTTEIRWLKWGLRGVLAAGLGLGGLSYGGVF